MRQIESRVFLFFTCLMLIGGGCAGPAVLVDSQPQGASVYYNGKESGKTPCTVRCRVSRFMIPPSHAH